MQIFTVGHSTRPIEAFIALLQSQHIKQLVDIRSIPKSLHNPQYHQAALEASTRRAGIKYLHLKELGGLRHKTKSTKNNAWRNRSFRNYADYMQTKEFKEGLDKVIQLSQESTTAIMCAEAVPWRCHRSLVGDALTVRDIQVRDIISESSVQDHRLTPFAVIHGTTITYPKTALTETKETH